MVANCRPARSGQSPIPAKALRPTTIHRFLNATQFPHWEAADSASEL
jgi:hypothetical protein